MRLVLLCVLAGGVVLLSAVASHGLALPPPARAAAAEPAGAPPFVPEDMPDRIDLRHVRLDIRKAYDNAVMRT